MDTPADATLEHADLLPADRLRMRLWLALIDAFVENAHLSTAWKIAHAIDTHWKDYAERMYQEGFEEGQRVALDGPEAQRARELELALLSASFKQAH